MQNLYEVLGNYESIEERKEKLEELKKDYDESFRLSGWENAYNFFITDRRGLYSIIKNSILDFDEKKTIHIVISDTNVIYCGRYYSKYEIVKEFLNKYGFTTKKYFDPRFRKIDMYYIDNIETMEDIKRLLNCFYLELQQINYYNMSKEELWERHKKFYENNKEWMTSEKIESHHKRG